MLECATAT